MEFVKSVKRMKNRSLTMKRILGMVLVLVMCAGVFTECGQNSKTSETSDKMNIVATDFAPYDFAKQVAGNTAEVTMLLAPGEEAHSFEPTPRDIIKIQNCDVFVYTGGESEEWVDDILESLDHEITTVRLMDCVELYEEEVVEGMEADDDEEDGEEAEYDEHVWTSPANAIEITKAVGDAFAKADPAYKSVYQENAEGYVRQLTELDQAFWDVVNSAKRKTLVFGDRFPLRYFVEEYGLSYYAAFPGCASETEPSAKTVAFLIDKVKEDQIPVVFHVEFSNEDMADTICEDTGAKKLQFNACHNISKEQFANGTSYLDLMWDNVEVLKEALK
jgi:zinc transport system substrate-binding protein